MAVRGFKSHSLFKRVLESFSAQSEKLLYNRGANVQMESRERVLQLVKNRWQALEAVSYTHLRAHETEADR
eukprot:4236617-Amphidinium_carterae.1